MAEDQSTEQEVCEKAHCLQHQGSLCCCQIELSCIVPFPSTVDRQTHEDSNDEVYRSSHDCIVESGREGMVSSRRSGRAFRKLVGMRYGQSSKIRNQKSRRDNEANNSDRLGYREFETMSHVE